MEAINLMKYWQLVNSKGHPAEVSLNDNITNDANDNNNIDNSEVIQRLSSIEEMLRDISKNKDQDEEKLTTMNDNQISDIISFMLKMKDEYFPYVTLSRDISADFIWNLPKCVYQTAQAMIAYDEPTMLNPLFWFTLFCVDLDKYVLARILKTILDEMERGTYDRINEIIAEHDAEIAAENAAIDSIDDNDLNGDIPPCDEEEEELPEDNYEDTLTAAMEDENINLDLPPDAEEYVREEDVSDIT